MKCPVARTASGPSIPAVALRIAVIIGLVIGATWAAHLIRDALDLTITHKNQQAVQSAVVVATIAYIGLMAIPFVPGAEIGIAMLTAFGAEIAPLIYGATIVSMMLAYSFGRLLPVALLARLLTLVRLRRAADLVTRAGSMPPEDRMTFLLEGAPPRTLGLALRYRYVALALSLNIPGNAVIGGGGGIMLLAGMSRVFTPLPTLLMVAIAVSPIPLAVLLFGA